MKSRISACADEWFGASLAISSRCVARVSRALGASIRWLLIVLALSGVHAAMAQAQGYPDKGRVIRAIVPSGAASMVDLLARGMDKAAKETSGVSFVVDNKPGAEGVVGIQAFLAAPADGYTMLFVSSSYISLNPVMIPTLPYDPFKDMQPVATISKAGLVMNLGISTPFKTGRDFVAAARAEPGKYTCATASTTQRMACELFQATAGIKLLVVPYKTTAAAMLAIASGEADTIFVDAGTALAQWATGRVRGVAVTTQERMAGLPAIATMPEQGVPDFLMSAWYAVYFKAGTPPAVVATMREILRKAAMQPVVRDALKVYVHEPLDLTPDEVVSLARREIDGWSKLVRERGISLSN